MGGKTQPRVAGNAKPTNSGRIRGLLVNQKLATGNVITFSALSAKANSQQATKQEFKTTAEKVEKVCEQPIDTSSQSYSESSEKVAAANQPTSKDNYKLVLRRVGNRELYTRVKITDDEALQKESAVEKSIAGVKKPSYSENLNTPVQVGDEESEQGNRLLQDEVVVCEGAQSDEGASGHEENVTFDELLHQMDEAKALIRSASQIGSLNELDEISSDNELRLIDIFRILIRKFSHELSIEDWDLIVDSLNKWIQWVSKSDHPLKESHQASLCAKVFAFIHQLIVYAEKLRQEMGDSNENPLMQSLFDDWKNFRSTSMFLDLIGLYLKLITFEKSDQEAESNKVLQPVIEALTHIIVTVDPRVVLTHHELLYYLDTRVEFDPEFKKPKNSIFCTLNEDKFKNFVAVCGLLRLNSRLTIVTAHAILSKVLDPVCENATQSAALISDQDAVEDILIFPPVSLMGLLTTRDSIMAALLSDYRVGDISVTVEPNTDAYSCTLAYLLTWDLIIRFIVGVEKQIGQCIIHSLKKLGLLQRLLDTIFMLLPPLDSRDSLKFRFESSDQNVTAEEPSCCIEDFLKSPLKTTVQRPLNEIELVALHLYFSVALHMPVTVRKWYNNNSNKRLCNLVNEYTVKHISQLICTIEMDSVQEKWQERSDRDDNLVIKARPNAKEVYAVYTRDEFKMELTIKLPLNYPLGSVQIDGGKRVGVTDVKWRSWLLQLTTFLAHQNGPILDGIYLWRKNIDKRFEGVEKCTICFSILHSNYQLPKKKCQTCSNIFHNVCLYKWFESSGNSTCPLCRNPW